MSVIFCEDTGDNWWTLSFQYDPEIVALIKALPTNHRAWSPEDKTWRVKVGSVTRLFKALSAYGHEVIK